jgi:hypothetical protein
MTDKGSGEWVVAVCGLNCAKCDVYLAGHGNEKLRGEIVQWLLERGSKPEEIKPEEITCGGCRSPLNIHWSPDCELLSCAKQKGYQYCFECTHFPCEKLQKFSSDGRAHHKRTVENMRRMKEIGLEAWIAQQNQKGLCVFCP